MLYGKIAPDDDFMVSHEVACVLGALTHDEEIYNHIEKQEGDVHMGQYVLLRHVVVHHYLFEFDE